MPTKSKASGDAIEKDAGYGESHGYSKTHGGPTGPGDAPAKPLPAEASKTAVGKAAKPAPRAGDAIDPDGRDSRRSATQQPAKKQTKTAGARSRRGAPHVDRSHSR